tara:strand:- start:2959 stop:4257 length:1299 start_codon:yes stop_codon:yes gene_type:complete
VVFGTTILGSNPSAPAKNMFLINNIKKILFPFYKEKKIREIFEILNSDKKNDAMLVGGCVRNFLNSESIGDIDIATIFTPEEIIKKFSNTDFKIIKTGIDHGTITLSKEGKNFEITTLREDIATDGRHAAVSFTKDWKKDSERRDFTINAIYLDQNGKIFDPQNGAQNLKEKKIKFIGDPQERIKEDYLRILRFLRFSIQYRDFDTEDQTFRIIQKNLNGIIKLSRERVFSELKKILSLDGIKDLFSNKEYYEIFKVIFPELKYSDKLKGMNLEIYKKFVQSEKNLLLALLLVDNTDNHIYFAHKYKVSSYLKEYLTFFHQFFYEAKKNKNFFAKDLKKNIFYHGKNKTESLAKFYFISQSKKNYANLVNILKKIELTNIPEFPLTGKDLLERGLQSGRKVGEILKKIEKKWIENDFNLKDEELKNLIKKYT